MNEQPIEVWENLFAHFSFPIFVELDGRQGRVSRMYLSSHLAPQGFAQSPQLFEPRAPLPHDVK